ncbi:aldo/keto reductase [Microbacterium sp. ASV49]|uniref:Aldo/keto reductase n=1 Tax=Microbacterium candidum TaxID=3041922 RepID=A0ABT7MTM0_9MICO|nr:aldo/keto reductase [Microbacterium sp. ASV49]MDL9977799.1 aldo/keto reductase [Microbacterium sp. ASV49]
MTPGFGPLGFGAAQLGNLRRVVSDDEATAGLQTAWDAGIRYFDTAPHYGLGLSERRLGGFLRQHPRDDYIVSTKVGRLLVPNPRYNGGRDILNGFDVPDDAVREFDPSPDGIRRSVEASLERMGIGRIDILYLHDPEEYDLERGLREGLPALAALRDEGLVSQIGVGVNDAAVASRAVREGDIDLVMIAGRWTLLDQSAAEELLPACAQHGVKIVAAGVYNSGLLSRPRPSEDAQYDYADAPPELVSRACRIADVCESFGVDLPTAAVHFPSLAPEVATVVVGASHPDAVRQNVERMGVDVPDSLWTALRDEWLIAS